MDLKRLQAISHRVHANQSDVAKEFVSNLKNVLAKRGYRADLAIATDAKSTLGRFTAAVRFDVELGHPSEDDLLALVAQTYPTHEIDWQMAEVDSDQGLVLLNLAPSVEIVPVKNISEIPPEFKAIGSGLYKRALDSTGNVSEIWTLKKGEDGLVLYRNKDDVEVKAAEEGFKAGDAVSTPYGQGRITKFDDYGNAFVQLGGKTRLVAAKEMKPYSIEKEKKLLTDYFSEMYGDETFASDLTKDYTTRKDSK